MKNIWITKRQERMNHPQTQIDLMVENQKIFSSVCNTKDFSPLVQKIYDGFLGFKMVSVQTMNAPGSLIKCLQRKWTDGKSDLVIEEEPLVAKARKLRTEFGLSLEETAKSIREEITREIAGDLSRNAGTVATWDWSTRLGNTLKEQYESLYVKIMEISCVVGRKTMAGYVNWLYMNEKTAKPLIACTSGAYPGTLSKGIYYHGTINGAWRLIIDTEYPDDQILLGHKGDSYMDAGYFYCPYFLAEAPKIENEDMCARAAYVNRYGKKLTKEGAKHYAKFTILNRT